MSTGMVTDTSAKRVLVIGDSMLDIYRYGKTERTAQEAACVVFSVRGERYCLGAAANVAANLRQYGLDVTLISAVGDDKNADQIDIMLRQFGITQCLLRTSGATRTRVRYCCSVSEQQVFRSDHDPLGVGDIYVEHIFTALCREQPRYDAVVVSDYRYGVITRGLAKQIEAARDRYGFLAADLPRDHGGHFSHIDLLVMHGRDLSTLKADVNELLATYGHHGLEYHSHGEKVFSLSALNKRPLCVVGAGDALLAAAVKAKLDGKTGGELATFANTQVAKLLSERGTCCPTEPYMETAHAHQG